MFKCVFVYMHVSVHVCVCVCIGPVMLFSSSNLMSYDVTDF